MSNKSRKPMTFDEHREIGRRIKLAERAILDVLEYNTRFYANENNRLAKSLRSLSLLKSRLESEMFREFPHLTNAEGFAVYYGALREGGVDDERDHRRDHRGRRADVE